MDLLPFNSRKERTPFVSAGDDLGERTTVSEKVSALSGKMVVDDVKSGKDTYRRLVFLSNPRVIQSEVRLLPKNNKNKDSNNSNNIDYHFLTSEYHQLMVAELSLLSPLIPVSSSSSPLRLLLIGLGGGVFPMFLHQHFPWLSLDVVELDPTVAEVAKECFGFQEDARMHLHIAEGVQFVRDRLAEAQKGKEKDNNNNNNTSVDPEKCYNIIIVDVDSKDVTVGMSCPPAAFLEPTFMDAVQSLLHPAGSLLVYNLACRSQSLLSSTLESLGKRFAQVCAAQAEEDINKVAACLPKKVEDCKKVVEEGVGALLKDAKAWDKDVFDLKEMAALIYDLAQEKQAPAAQDKDKEKEKEKKKSSGAKKGGKGKGKKKGKK